jgi:hypothetical protein
MRPALRFPVRFTRYGIGDKQFRGPNPPAGALITYSLKEKLAPEEPAKKGDSMPETPKPERVKIEILDASGMVVRTLK